MPRNPSKRFFTGTSPHDSEREEKLRSAISAWRAGSYSGSVHEHIGLACELFGSPFGQYVLPTVERAALDLALAVKTIADDHGSDDALERAESCDIYFDEDGFLSLLEALKNDRRFHEIDDIHSSLNRLIRAGLTQAIEHQLLEQADDPLDGIHRRDFQSIHARRIGMAVQEQIEPLTKVGDTEAYHLAVRNIDRLIAENLNDPASIQQAERVSWLARNRTNLLKASDVLSGATRAPSGASKQDLWFGVSLDESPVFSADDAPTDNSIEEGEFGDIEDAIEVSIEDDASADDHSSLAEARSYRRPPAPPAELNESIEPLRKPPKRPETPQTIDPLPEMPEKVRAFAHGER